MSDAPAEANVIDFHEKRTQRIIDLEIKLAQQSYYIRMLEDEVKHLKKLLKK